MERVTGEDDIDFVGLPISTRLISCDGEMRVPDSALMSVVYLGNGDTAAEFHPIGTGFLVNLQRPLHDVTYYLITADHVMGRLKDKKRFAIRFNDKSGKSHIQQSQPYFSWWHHPTDKSVDAAVYPWGFQGDFSTFDSTRFVNRWNLELTRIGVGDEIFIVGLFRKWAGNERVVPMVRHGHIAMMAGERLPTKNYGLALMHLVELFSLAGMSGSPVFARQTIPIPVASRNDFEPTNALALGNIYLLGLIHGIYPTEAAIEVGEPGKGQLWHSGISMVVPADQILEILSQPKLLEYETMIAKKGTSPVESAIAHAQTPRRKTRDVEIPSISRDKFFSDLAKATRRKKPSS